VAAPQFEIPKLTDFIEVRGERRRVCARQVIPANAAIQEIIGYPGELVEDWHDKAIAKMGDLLGRYRSLQVFMDAWSTVARARQVPLLPRTVIRKTCRSLARI